MGLSSAQREGLGERAVAHLEALLALDTSNPPGNESLVAEHVAEALLEAGLEPRVVAREPGRANVVARMSGTGELPPLLLHSHSDVVPAEPSGWAHPPFGAVRSDGCLWGRGALDNKSTAAMQLAVVEALAREAGRLRRDVILAVVADEEEDMRAGSRFLVDEHPELVRAEHAIGEFGGFTTRALGLEVMPVQVAQKGICWIRARTTGTAGHGSVPRGDSAIVKIAAAAAKIGSRRLPVHLCEPVSDYLRRLAASVPDRATRAAIGLLRREVTAGPVLDHGLRDEGVRAPMVSMLTNTASITKLHAGDKTNVIPGEAVMEIDGRTIPGQGPADLVAELETLAPGPTYEVLAASPSVATSPEGPVLEAIERVVAAELPGVLVLPFLLPGATDASSWARLGARCYGFVPLPMPEGFPPFFDLIHGVDERVPVDSLIRGTSILAEVVAEVCS